MNISSESNSVWKMLKDLSSKKGITEILINGPKSVFVEKDGRFIQLQVDIEENDLSLFAQEVASINQKEYGVDNPILDGSLPDGSRINIVSPPFSVGFPAIAIRKYIKSLKSFDDGGFFGINEFWRQFLKSLVKSKMNIMVAGGTGVGKTTFLNMLLSELQISERVVCIEDTLELSINIPNLVRLETRDRDVNSKFKIRVRDLVKNALRMRPDRIIIGESRGDEFFDLLQAMNTGHNGSMSSIHANSTRETLIRMESLYLLAGLDVPTSVIRKQISSALNFIIHLSRNKKGDRIVSSISEITGMEGNNILMQTIGELKDDCLVKTGIVPQCQATLVDLGELRSNYFE